MLDQFIALPQWYIGLTPTLIIIEDQPPFTDIIVKQKEMFNEYRIPPHENPPWRK